MRKATSSFASTQTKTKPDTKNLQALRKGLEIHFRRSMSQRYQSQGVVSIMFTQLTFSHFHSLLLGSKVELTNTFQFSSSTEG